MFRNKDNEVTGCSIKLLFEILKSSILEEAKSKLIKPISDEEIQKIMFSIDGKKAPGPDGFTDHFFKVTWSIVGKDVIEAILFFSKQGIFIQPSTPQLLLLFLSVRILVKSVSIYLFLVVLCFINVLQRYWQIGLKNFC